eukprot:TRINITY_DN6314_c0_g1_i1.p1 TRINITY_DN6314_c0_g1~~TRINITY_DN6314_c0_g1_i1.p1  ORF type:complete len:649 (-),score=165.71 TRINITY_DN6314_c0_g1_i1:298-2244(-)
MIEFDVCLEDGGSLECKAPRPEEGKKFEDLEGVRAFDRLKQDLPRHRARCGLANLAPLQLQRLNLSGHDLGDRCVRAMVEAFLKGSVRIGTLELYKNRLGDASAQALGQLIQYSPAPGVNGLHLSHNYFTPAGVSFMIDAASSCGFYPMDRGGSWAPLWLRVENQQVAWPQLSDRTGRDQFNQAAKLLEQKEKSLREKREAALRERNEVSMEPFENVTRLICMPPPRDGFKWEENWDTHDYEKVDKYITCNSAKCVHGCQFGPVVHLPYFWSQRCKGWYPPPEASKLHERDAEWKTWKPRLPIGFKPNAIADSKPERSQDPSIAASQTLGDSTSSALNSGVAPASVSKLALPSYLDIGPVSKSRALVARPSDEDDDGGWPEFDEDSLPQPAMATQDDAGAGAKELSFEDVCWLAGETDAAPPTRPLVPQSVPAARKQGSDAKPRDSGASEENTNASKNGAPVQGQAAAPGRGRGRGRGRAAATSRGAGARGGRSATAGTAAALAAAAARLPAREDDLLVNLPEVLALAAAESAKAPARPPPRAAQQGVSRAAGAGAAAASAPAPPARGKKRRRVVESDSEESAAKTAAVVGVAAVGATAAGGADREAQAFDLFEGYEGSEEEEAEAASPVAPSAPSSRAAFAGSLSLS